MKEKGFNHNAPWDAEDVWIAFNEGTDMRNTRRLVHVLGRTAQAIYNAAHSVHQIAPIQEIDAAREYLEDKRWSKRSIEAFLECWRRINLRTRYEPKYPKRASVVTQPPTENHVTTSPPELDQLIANLDMQFTEMKRTIIKIVELTVERRVAKYKQDKEEEIASLRTVVDAARQSSLTEGLRRITEANP